LDVCLIKNINPLCIAVVSFMECAAVPFFVEFIFAHCAR
jgi:hypothetical protein